MSSGEGAVMTDAGHPRPGDRSVDGVAATVVLVRDAAPGAEVLLLERPHDRGSFAGAWVFPGGVVEQSDASVANPTELAAATTAAARETLEETGLAVAEDDLVATACWVPPQGVAKRMRTWFFLAAAPDGDVVLSPDESVAFSWLRPADALARHAEGALRLFPPTWVTLHGLVGIDSVEDAVGRARAGTAQRFASRFAADRRTIYWLPDVAYDDDALADEPGARHRLLMASRPWRYEVQD
jgi:NTP pyrophosphohydrolases containing a Zn-finger, probably nucleic-acid-binding